MSKWNRVYAVDLAERAAASAVGGLLTMLTLTSLTDLSWGYVWAVVGVPTATSLLKGLLANLPGTDASASIVNVTSSSGGTSEQP